MPKRFPGWAESGARLPLDVDVEFTSRPSPERESLVPKDSTCVCAEGESSSSFVSENGREEVSFLDGGWCIQRPTGNIKNSEGSLVKPEGLLHFWLDCPSGARKRDAEIFPSTRIFFTTGVWDDMRSLDAMRSEYETVVEDLQTVVDDDIRSSQKTKTRRQEPSRCSAGQHRRGRGSRAALKPRSVSDCEGTDRAADRDISNGR